MSLPVLSDAQMGMFQVIRPFSGFESVYQGQDGTIPIAFPGTLDPEAGKEGLIASLMAGIAVPLASRLLLQIPMTAYNEEGDIIPLDSYEYQIVWRTRNQQWFTSAATAGRPVSAYHLPSEGIGRNQVMFIPGASDVEVFEQSEPVSGAARLNVLQQRYRPKVTTSWVQPLLPNGDNGAWQQGVYNSQSSVNSVGPSWVPLWLDSSGDELMILAYKIDTDAPWDFTSVSDDRAFSLTYGTNNGNLPNNPNIGIILSTGTMGS